MSKLSSTNKRFEIDLLNLTTGETFRGVVDEPPEGEPAALRFNVPRRVLRVDPTWSVSTGAAIQTPAGVRYLVGDHGPSESRDELLFRAYRLVTVTNVVPWVRRVITTHPVSGVPVDGVPTSLGNILGAKEQDRSLFDRGLSATFPSYLFITNAAVQADDEVDGHKVIRIDRELGLTLCELQ